MMAVLRNMCTFESLVRLREVLQLNIVERNCRLTYLCNRFPKPSLDKEIIADSLACMQKTLDLLTRTLAQMEKSAETLSKHNL